MGFCACVVISQSRVNVRLLRESNMARKRNYREEYRRRIERGLARGLSRSQARGHPKPSERPVEAAPVKADSKINAAILEMNRNTSMTAAARSRHVSAERLRRFVAVQRLGESDGRRWVMTDSRPRIVQVMTGGRERTLTVDGYDQARLVGEHHQAVGEFVRTNDIELIKPFEGRSVRGANGREYPLETDPNELHRIASMDMPPFHEIYAITSTT